MAAESKVKTKKYRVIKGTVQRGVTTPGGEGKHPVQRLYSHREGEEIELEAGDAEELLALGVIEEAGKPVAVAPPAPASAAPKEGVTITETPKAAAKSEPAPKVEPEE